MPLNTDTARVAMQVSRDIVVASIQVDLDDEVLACFRDDLLERIHQTGSRGVIFDVSGLETLDSTEFAALRSIIAMSSIMGAESVLVGLRPGVVSSLIDAGAEVDGVRAAIDLDAAFELLEAELALKTEPESEAESVQDEDGEEDGEEEPPLESAQTAGDKR